MSALTDLFANIANAIRAKTGDTATISAANFPTAIANIQTGASVVTGTVRGDTTLSIPNAIGKANCVILNQGIGSLRNINITGGGHIDSVSFVPGITFRSEEAHKCSTAMCRWNSATGIMSIETAVGTQTYVYIAW